MSILMWLKYFICHVKDLIHFDMKFFLDMIYDLSSLESETVNQISVSTLCAETSSQCQEIKAHTRFYKQDSLI